MQDFKDEPASGLLKVAKSQRTLSQTSIEAPNITAIFKDFLNNFFKSNSGSDQEDNFGAKILDYLKRDLELQETDSVDLTKVQTQQRYELYQEIASKTQLLLTVTIPFRHLDSIKTQLKLILENYRKYFSKIDDYSKDPQVTQKLGEEVLKSFIEGGALYNRINSLETTELEKISSVAKNMFFLFNKLILEFEEARISESSSEESTRLEQVKQKIFLTLEKFPANHPFACLDGLESQLIETISSLAFESIFQRIFYEKFQASVAQISFNASIPHERHVSAFLLHLLNANETQEEIDALVRLDVFFRIPHFDINLSIVFQVLEKFKSENFFSELLHEYEEFYNSDARLKSLEFDLSEDFESDSLKNQASVNLSKIANNISSKFNPRELQALAINSYFFLDDQDKLLTPAQLKEKISKVISEKLSLLYPHYYSEGQIDFFKHLCRTTDLFSATKEDAISDNASLILDPRKMLELINMFQKINETDSEKLKRSKLAKTASCLFVLKQIEMNRGFFGISFQIDSQQPNVTNPIYYFDFFEEFKKQQGVDFFEFFFDQQGAILDQYQLPELQPILEFFKKQQEKIKQTKQIIDSQDQETKEVLRIKKIIDEQNLDELREYFFREPYLDNAFKIYVFIKNSCHQNALYKQGIIATLAQTYRHLKALTDQTDNLKNILIFDQNNIFKIALQKKRFDVASDIVDYLAQDIGNPQNPQNEIAERMLDLTIGDRERNLTRNPKLTTKILSILVANSQTSQERLQDLLIFFKSYSFLQLLFGINDFENFKIVLEFLRTNESPLNHLDIQRIEIILESLLLACCSEGKSKFAKLILKQGGVYEIGVNNLVVNRLNDESSTALNMACFKGHTDIVKLLLAIEDIDVNKASGNNGCCALHFACSKGHIEIVKLLLARKDIDVNKASSDSGCCALHFACSNGHKEIVKLLLARDDIDVNKASSDYGCCALHFACSKGHKEIVKLLLARDDIVVNSDDTLGYNALHMACIEGHTAIVELLLERPAIDINKIDNAGQSALALACEKNHPAIVKLLLTRMSEIWTKMSYSFREVTNQNIINLLDYSRRENNAEITELLTDFSNQLTSQRHSASESVVQQLSRDIRQPARQEPDQDMAPPNPLSRSLISSSTQTQGNSQEVQVSASLTFANLTQESGITTSDSALSPSNQDDQSPQSSLAIDQQQSLRRVRCIGDCTIS